jgi:hypothetical protein
MMSEKLEILIENGLCKVIEGAARRTYFSTEEAVGLALLKHNPNNQAVNVAWQDFLRTKGLAFTAQGNKCLTIMTYPSQAKTIRCGRGGEEREMVVKFPPLLFAMKLQGKTLVRSSIWCIKAGFEGRLSLDSADPCLAPFPYGNVYNHGGVCWGSTDIRNVRHPQEVEDLFFGSVFNGDLMHLGSNVGAPDALTMTQLFTKFKENIPAPVATSYTASMEGVARDLVR